VIVYKDMGILRPDDSSHLPDPSKCQWTVTDTGPNMGQDSVPGPGLGPYSGPQEVDMNIVSSPDTNLGSHPLPKPPNTDFGHLRSLPLPKPPLSSNNLRTTLDSIHLGLDQLTFRLGQFDADSRRFQSRPQSDYVLGLAGVRAASCLSKEATDFSLTGSRAASGQDCIVSENGRFAGRETSCVNFACSTSSKPDTDIGSELYNDLSRPFIDDSLNKSDLQRPANILSKTCNNSFDLPGSILTDSNISPAFVIPNLQSVKFEAESHADTSLSILVSTTNIRPARFRRRDIHFISLCLEARIAAALVQSCHSKSFRTNLLWKLIGIQSPSYVLLVLSLHPSTPPLDYAFCIRILRLLRRSLDLEVAMAWLSTLGGGFSALGDYYTLAADKAGRISMAQMKLALEMGDPITVAKAWIWFSISLIQKGDLERAWMVVRRQMAFAKSEQGRFDPRLKKMCEGVRAKIRWMREKEIDR